MMAINIPGISSAQGGGRSNRVSSEQSDSAVSGRDNAAQPSASRSSADTVNISDTAQAIQSAVQQLSNEPDVNSDRVAELKSAIESGEYKTDASRIANSMLAIESLFS